jgi:hypothetical protein
MASGSGRVRAPKDGSTTPCGSGQDSLRDTSQKVCDLTLSLDQVAEGYRAMDERRAIKTLLRP